MGLAHKMATCNITNLFTGSFLLCCNWWWGVCRWWFTAIGCGRCSIRGLIFFSLKKNQLKWTTSFQNCTVTHKIHGVIVAMDCRQSNTILVFWVFYSENCLQINFNQSVILTKTTTDSTVEMLTTNYTTCFKLKNLQLIIFMEHESLKTTISYWIEWTECMNSCTDVFMD